ncbi:MAG: IMP cyclohydrolase [Clostridiales bacterium]|nr:IMP cyclohydrolase [Candidatus Crickella merdequi]
MNVYTTRQFKEIVEGNEYPGRGIIAGLTPDGSCAVNAYFIMGRSANSRNRVFKERDGAIFTEPFDASKVEDPSLIIYAAIREYENKLVVTNGNQTDTIYEGLLSGKSEHDTLLTRCFEPDAPNLTPRISSVTTFDDFGGFTYTLSILKSADAEGTACNRFFYEYAPLNGLGHFIHTYETNGNPLPTFSGEPRRVEIPDSIDDFTDEIWNSLNEENKISLYVRYTDLATGKVETRMINKNC